MIKAEIYNRKEMTDSAEKYSKAIAATRCCKSGIEQLVCKLCEEPMEKVMGKVCEKTMCDRHR